MKILFAKVPDSDVSDRVSFELDGFSPLPTKCTSYGLMYHDNNGEVFALPFTKDELNSGCIFDINKLFSIDVDIIKDVTIAFFVDTPKGTLLDGWYKHAEIFKDCQSKAPLTDRYYVFKAKAVNSVWLPIDVHFETKLVFNDFFVPTGSDARKILDFISTYSGERLNVIFDEALASATIPKIDSVDKCIKYCTELYQKDDRTPLHLFQMIKLCLQTVEKHGENETIYELLADLYVDLEQPDLALKYDRLRFELNPTYENKRCYGLSLYDSKDWQKAISIFSELLDEKPNDDLKMHLADLYCFDGYIQAAYNLYDQVNDKSLLDEKNRVMEEIKTILPNISREKIYRVNNNIIKISEEITYLPIELMPLPHEQIINGKTFYLDPIRKKPILKTPEEEIRQKVIRFLLEKLEIPDKYIYVEESLSHFDRELKDRIDILVSQRKNGMRDHLLIVECKEPRISIVGEPVEQILRYNFYCNAKYLLITNGNYNLIYAYNSLTDEYYPCSKMPSFHEMIQATVDDGIRTIIKNNWQRPNREILETSEYLDNAIFNGIIGEDTPKNTAIFALNLHYCLIDPDENIPCPLQGAYCKIDTDYGLTNRTSGNPAGGMFNRDFRWLKTITRDGDVNNVYVAIAGTGKCINDPVFGNRKGISIIMVSIEHKGQAVPMLQLSLDAFAKQNGTLFTITHNGRRSRRTNNSTLEYIKQKCTPLIKDGKIYLGCIDNCKNLSLNGKLEKDFMQNLIDYSVLRYELWVQDRIKDEA